MQFYYNTRPLQEAQKIFKSNGPMETAAIKTKLLGFGMQLLEGIDPNPENFVCAAIIHTRTQQIGCLLRLEPNRQAQVCFEIILSIVQSCQCLSKAWLEACDSFKILLHKQTLS